MTVGFSHVEVTGDLDKGSLVAHWAKTYLEWAQAGLKENMKHKCRHFQVIFCSNIAGK